MSGITDVLADNISSARTLFTFDAVYIKAVRVDYTIVRGTAVRTGTYTIVAGTDASGTDIQGSDSGVQNSAPGQTFSVSETGSVVSWKYTTTSTSVAGTIYYSVTKLA
jgi:predicted RecA/RadA family phage recombinase